MSCFRVFFLGDGIKGYGVLWNIDGMVRVVQVLCVLQSASGRPSPAWGGRLSLYLARLAALFLSGQALYLAREAALFFSGSAL